MKTLRKVSLLLVAGLTANSLTLPAQTVTVLHAFSAFTGITNSDGGMPRADLVLSGHLLYGAASDGGSTGDGTIFSLNTNGSNFTVLHTFSGGSDGALPNKTLVLSGSTLYGIAGRGTNAGDFGSVFSMDASGTNFNPVYPFTGGSDGAIGAPNGGLILAGDTLYGTANQGGISNAGTIFSLTTNGGFNPLHQFVAATDGSGPLGTLLLVGDTLYGTARNGGTNGVDGTIFSIKTNGQDFTVLYTFAGGASPSGHNPDAGLTLVGQTLYGTTSLGGTNVGGALFSINTDGSGFTVWHSFGAASDGKLPEGNLLPRGDTLYGTTVATGSTLNGTVFAINTNGTEYTLLHTFAPASVGATNTDGAQPFCTLAMAGNILYGTCSMGASGGQGCVFSLTVAPTITGLSFAGSNVVLSGINGVSGSTYTLLQASSVNAPLIQWAPIATNTLPGGGNFTFIATNAFHPAAPREFYILRAQ